MSDANSRPLEGKRVLVTRSRQQSRDFVEKLEALGATVLVSSAITIVPPDDWTAVDEALQSIDQFHWLIFTSANGVRALCKRMTAIGGNLDALSKIKIAAIGPATATALQEFHLNADLVPTRYQSEDLAESLLGYAAGKRILLARGDRGRELLSTQLRKVAEVVEVVVYRQFDVDSTDGQIRDLLQHGEIDIVTLTSGNIACSFLRQLDAASQNQIRSGRTKLISFSPRTSAAVAEMGYHVVVESREFTTDGMIRAIEECVCQPKK